MSSFDSLGLKICLFVFLQKLDSKKNNYDQLIDKFRGSSTLLIDKHTFLITSLMTGISTVFLVLLLVVK
jgi:hypothetical protein